MITIKPLGRDHADRQDLVIRIMGLFLSLVAFVPVLVVRPHEGCESRRTGLPGKASKRCNIMLEEFQKQHWVCMMK